MKKKGTWMRASAGALSAAMVLGSVTVAPAVKAENVEEKAGYEVNYALNSKVTASNQELANQWGPEKAVDGIVNRDAGETGTVTLVNSTEHHTGSENVDIRLGGSKDIQSVCN